MGVISGLHCYGYLKPTLEINLIEGGNLKSNTKYYIVGFYSTTPNVYTGISGPLSDVYEITTTDTHKSIEIGHKTYRDIQSFTDNGDGRTIVNCIKHCFVEGDDFTIDTGSYTSGYTVDEWVDYNNFIIDTPYIDNSGSTCYSEGLYNYSWTGYGIPSTFVRYWISEYYPYNSNNSFSTSNYFTSSSYSTYNNTNPTIITSQPTEIFYGGNVNLLSMDKGLFRELISEGSVLVYGTNGNHTLKDIYDEVQSSGFIKNCSYSSSAGYMNKKSFFIHGTIKLNGSNTYLTDSYCDITIMGGELLGSGSNKITLNNCLVLYNPSSFSHSTVYTSNNGVFWNNSPSNAIVGYIYGDNVFCGTQRFNSSYGDEVTSYINLKTNNSYNVGIVRNKSFLPTSNQQLNQVSYDNTIFENCSLFTIYQAGANIDTGNEPDRYIYKNCYIFKSDNRNEHIRFYTYKPDSEFIYTGLNIDTDEEDNKKIISNTVAGFVEFYFYREVKIKVKNENGDTIEGVNINAIDNQYNTYSGLTDINGELIIEYLEQKTKYLKTDGIITNYNSDYYTYYNGIDLIISKYGYETETVENVDNYRDKGYINLPISLKKQVPLMVDSSGKIHIKMNPENIGNNREFLI